MHIKKIEKKKREIIGISASPEIGGASVIFQELAFNLPFYKLFIHTSLEKGLNLNISVSFIHFNKLMKNVKSILRFSFYYIFTVIKLHRNIPYKSIIIANDFLSFLYCWVFNLFLKADIIFYCHSTFKHSTFNSIFLSKFINKFSSLVIVPSVFLKHELEMLNIESEKIKVVYNGIRDCQDLISSSERVSCSKIFISLIGDIVDLKGQDVFCEAIEKLSLDTNLQIKGILAGKISDQAYHNNLTTRFKKMFASGHLSYRGQVKRQEALQIINDSDIIVCCSKHSEVFPTVLLEGLSLGKVIVGTTIGGIPEIITHGFNGYLIKPDSPEALADALTSILKNNKLLQIKRNSRRTYEGKFSINAYIENFRSILLSLS